MEPLGDLVRTTVQLGGSTVEVHEIDVEAARAALPRLMWTAAETGCTFRIRGGEDPSVDVLLMSPQALERFLLQPTQHRTLGDVLDALPFKAIGVQRLRVVTPDNRVRSLCIPSSSD